jgi:hypothetical protein
MIIPSIDDDITLEIADGASETDTCTWSAGDLTIELSGERPTDPQSRPFDIDEWTDMFASESGVPADAIRVAEPRAPDDIGGIALDAAGTEIRLILFSADNGDYRTARIRLANAAALARARAIRIRSQSRSYDKALGDILPS